MRNGWTGPRKATNGLVPLIHRAETNVVLPCCTLPTVRLLSNPQAGLRCDLFLPICGHICRMQMVRVLCDPLQRRHSWYIGHGTALQLGSVPGSRALHAQKPCQKPYSPSADPFLLFNPCSVSDTWMMIGLNSQLSSTSPPPPQIAKVHKSNLDKKCPVIFLAVVLIV